jgi:hypothetical protein
VDVALGENMSGILRSHYALRQGATTMFFGDTDEEDARSDDDTQRAQYRGSHTPAPYCRSLSAKEKTEKSEEEIYLEELRAYVGLAPKTQNCPRT